MLELLVGALIMLVGLVLGGLFVLLAASARRGDE